MEIRKAKTSDLLKLQKICKTTFIQTFEKDNKINDINQYIEKSFSTQVLKLQLENPKCLFYLALLENKISAYMKLNTDNAQTESMGHDAIELERIYVLEQYKGQYIGSYLINKAIEIGRMKRKKFIWLGVWEHNTKAITFYEKKGFVRFDFHRFKLGDDVQIDLLMKKKI